MDMTDPTKQVMAYPSTKGTAQQPHGTAPDGGAQAFEETPGTIEDERTNAQLETFFDLEGQSSKVVVEAWSDARFLKDFFGRAHSLVNECRVRADGGGLHMIAVDSAYIALVDLHLPRESLEYYRLAPDAPPLESGPVLDIVEFGVDLKKLEAVIKAVKGRVVMRFCGDPRGGRLEVASGGSVRTMATLDTKRMADVKVPLLDLPVKFRMSGRPLCEALKACEAISGYAGFVVHHEGDPQSPASFRVIIQAEGDPDRYEYRFGAEVTCIANDGFSHRSLFRLDYLVGFLKQVKGEELYVQLGTDYPLRLDWDGATRGTYLVAPRVEP